MNDRRRTPLGWRVVSLALLVVVPVACAHRGAHGRGPGGGRGGRALAPAPVPTIAARLTTVRPTLSIAGIIAPLQNVTLTSSLAEPTLSVTVNEGDVVHAGEVLATLDTSDLQASLVADERVAQSDAARSDQARYQAQITVGQAPDQVRSARAAVAQAQQTLDQANGDLARDAQLVTQGYIAEQQMAQQRTTVANDASALRSARAQLSSATTNQSVNGSTQGGLQGATIASAVAQAASASAQADQIRAQIARGTIVSPVDGVVENRNLNPGEYPSGRTLFTIQEIGNVYAELNASSSDVFAIPTGAAVTVVAGNDASGRRYAGRIVAVLGQVQPGSTNFTVKALLPNPGNRLQAGVPVTATIALPARRGVGIPEAAFLDDTHTSVMVAENGVAHVATVRDEGTNGATSVVSGIAAGTHVVANGQLGLTNGQRLGRR